MVSNSPLSSSLPSHLVRPSKPLAGFSSTEPFPLLGFPNETNERVQEIVYRCFLGDDCRAVLWERNKQLQDKGNYAVNIYRGRITDHILTHMQDRYCITQGSIAVEDAFEAQLAINYLIQKHLPQEVIDDINRQREEERERAQCSGAGEASAVRAGCQAGEVVE